MFNILKIEETGEEKEKGEFITEEEAERFLDEYYPTYLDNDDDEDDEEDEYYPTNLDNDEDEDEDEDDEYYSTNLD